MKYKNYIGVLGGLAACLALFACSCVGREATAPDVLVFVVDARDVGVVTNAATPFFASLTQLDAEGSDFQTGDGTVTYKSAIFLSGRDSDMAGEFRHVFVNTNPATASHFPLLQYRAYPERFSAGIRNAESVAEAARQWISKQRVSTPLVVYVELKDFLFADSRSQSLTDDGRDAIVRSAIAAYMDLRAAQLRDALANRRKTASVACYLICAPDRGFTGVLREEQGRYEAANPEMEAETMTEILSTWRDVAFHFRDRSVDFTASELVEKCQSLVEAYPDYAPFHTWLGIAYAKDGQHEQAVMEHLKALECDPKAEHLLSNVGLAYLGAGDVATAVDKLENAFLVRQQRGEFSDNLAHVLMGLGMSLAAEKMYNDAVACMSRVILLQPKNPVAHFNMGNIYRSMGRIEAAEVCFRKALDFAPKFAPAQKALETIRNHEN